MIDIMSILPHREPFLFIDEVIDISANRITAVRKLEPDEYFFKGHYPGNPIMPGTLTCESMFQAGAILMSERHSEKIKGIPLVTRVNNVKFKKLLKPGDEMLIEVIFIESMANAYMFKAKVRSNEVTAASCDFTCIVIPED